MSLLDPGNGKTKRAYLWAYRNNTLGDKPPTIVLDFQSGRSGSLAQAVLHGWQGSFMVDDYAGYKALFAQSMTELVCFAKVPRKLFDLLEANHYPIAADALLRIDVLYPIEAKCKDNTIEQRQQRRHTHALPLLQNMHTRLVQTRRQTADSSSLAENIDYSLRRWMAIERYVNSGHLPIDNHLIENAIRPIAIGKKNWLFVGSVRAGKQAAAVQSLLATAKANGIEPSAWLKSILEKLPTHPNSRIDESLPLRA